MNADGDAIPYRCMKVLAVFGVSAGAAGQAACAEALRPIPTGKRLERRSGISRSCPGKPDAGRQIDRK